MNDQYRRKVGTVRPSHLMFTTGVGALVDLPNFSVLVSGLDRWRYDNVPNHQPIDEPRLLAAVQKILNNRHVKELRPAPWVDDDGASNSLADRVGVPTIPFPTWLRCTACNELAPLASKTFLFGNDQSNRPHDARFYHERCGKKKSRKPLAVPTRFMLACTAGHLDDFPYREFVHRGQPCPTGSTHPRMQMEDRGGNIGVNVNLKCLSCETQRNIRDALGDDGTTLPNCRGRHPHLDVFEENGCDQRARVLVVGSSNQWFAHTLSVLSLPRSPRSDLDDLVEQHWKQIEPLAPAMYPYARDNVPAFRVFDKWDDNELAAAVERVRARKTQDGEQDEEDDHVDLLTPEWETLSSIPAPDPELDFALRRDPAGVPTPLKEIFCDVAQVERLRQVRALVGFTRLDAPDPEDPGLVTRAPLSREETTWVPASEVRGEGIFLRVPDDLLAEWEQRVRDSEAMRLHRAAYAQYRRNRYSDRIKGPFDEMRNWPGARYIALHTLSHLLIRTIALDCGYSSASLSERIYAGTEDDPRGGILISTAAPDSEGTLGGLVSQAEPDRLVLLVRKALRDATRCSSDPLCKERLPQPHAADFLHGAACHVCLFVSETTCERGNRFLDRRFVVPIDDPALALFKELP